MNYLLLFYFVAFGVCCIGALISALAAIDILFKIT